MHRQSVYRFYTVKIYYVPSSSKNREYVIVYVEFLLNKSVPLLQQRFYAASPTSSSLNHTYSQILHSVIFFPYLIQVVLELVNWSRGDLRFDDFLGRRMFPFLLEILFSQVTAYITYFSVSTSFRFKFLTTTRLSIFDLRLLWLTSTVSIQGPSNDDNQQTVSSVLNEIYESLVLGIPEDPGLCPGDVVEPKDRCIPNLTRIRPSNEIPRQVLGCTLEIQLCRTKRRLKPERVYTSQMRRLN